MKPHIKLKEIIWEITNCCLQNCSYCGSKDIINQTEIDVDDIALIVDKIAEFPPEEIDISGGNPLLVPLETHKYIIKTLHEKDVTCKLIINPFNIRTSEIPAMYDWVGLSINTKFELEEVINKQYHKNFNLTVITNFNTSNVFLFSDIEKYVLENDLNWQIQYTMYKSYDEKAIYLNSESVDFLMGKVYNSKSKITLADNMNQGQCTAGIYSIGILANGDVIPCLSMRSWDSNNCQTYYQNLLNSEFTLQDIWIYSFAEFRCSGFTCCKDITGCVNEKPSEPVLNINTPKTTNPSIIKNDYEHTYPNMVCMYGVNILNPSPIPFPNSQGVYAYAVIGGDITKFDSTKNSWGAVNTNNLFNLVKEDK